MTIEMAVKAYSEAYGKMLQRHADALHSYSDVIYSMRQLDKAIHDKLNVIECTALTTEDGEVIEPK